MLQKPAKEEQHGLCIAIAGRHIQDVYLAWSQNLVPEVLKLLFMLNSVDHEILNAPKYKDIKKFGFF